MLPQLQQDADGSLLCSFQDRTTSGDRGSVVRFDAAADTWGYVGQAGEPSIRVDWWGVVQPVGSGWLYRANRDYGFPRNGLGLWRFQPGTADWAPFGPQPLSAGEAHYIDVELDASGRLLIGFQDGLRSMTSGPGAAGAATVLRIDPGSGDATSLGGTGFTSEFASTSDASHVDLEVAANGTLWAAWTESGLGLAHPRVARFHPGSGSSPGSGSWSLVGSPASGLPDAGAHVSIAIDASGRPLIAFRGNAPLRFLVYRMDLAANTWSQVGDDIHPSQLGSGGSPGFSREAGYRERTPFVVGPAGSLYLAHLTPDANEVDRVQVLTFREDAWVPVGASGFLPGSEPEDYVSLAAISENGVEVPIVACRRSPQTPNERLVGYAFR
ncbi:hypothetical protein Poly30_02950 [Planctomycetes bacterium Poly30]|uniref:Uncharacterized protein n=2 Tax=Saltatorellus ferox TaxID=2528018 RepID=A0A518EL40_9BACT|nr:hypothetical protein Poly30_02950 [Planctomycetes bacterium Poly30]